MKHLALRLILCLMALPAQSQEPLEQPVAVRIELRRDGDTVAVLELAGSQLRWSRRQGCAIQESLT